MRKFIVLRVRRVCLVLTLIFSTIGCDQATKIAARDTLPSTGAISYLNNMFRLEYAENPGAFLNLGASLRPQLHFLIFTVAISGFLLALGFLLLHRSWDLPLTIAASLIVGGGIGNVIDRIARGRVIDFMNLGIGNLRTGIFNVADVAIMTGAFLLLVYSRENRHRPCTQKVHASKPGS